MNNKPTNFTFAFLRRFGESFRHIAQPLIIQNNNSKRIFDTTYVSSPANRIGCTGLNASFVQDFPDSFDRSCSQIGSSLFAWISNT
jgi:hypothetical protein